jgi:hypothetical protein
METKIPEISKSKIKKSFSEFRDSLLDPEFIVSLKDLEHRNLEGREAIFVNDIIDGLLYSDLKFSGNSLKNGETKFSFDTFQDEEGKVKVRRIHTISICTRDLLTNEELKELFTKGLADVLEVSIFGTSRKRDVWNSLIKRIKQKSIEGKGKQ